MGTTKGKGRFKSTEVTEKTKTTTIRIGESRSKERRIPELEGEKESLRKEGRKPGGKLIARLIPKNLKNRGRSKDVRGKVT